MSRYHATQNHPIASILGVATAFMVAVLSVMLSWPASAGADPSELPVGASFRECADCPEMVVVPRGVDCLGALADQHLAMAQDHHLGLLK